MQFNDSSVHRHQSESQDYIAVNNLEIILLGIQKDGKENIGKEKRKIKLKKRKKNTYTFAA